MKKILLTICFLVAVCFAGENYWQKGGYVDFNGTAHNGFGSNHGGAISLGFGGEYLYVVNSNFAIGANAKTNVSYDAYMNYDDPDVPVVDEYGIWTITAGGIMYVGDYFFAGYNAIYNLSTFHHDTYLSYDDREVEMDGMDYEIDNLNYSVILGIRTSYHTSIYTEITTHVIKTDFDTNRHQFYIGFQYHI